MAKKKQTEKDFLAGQSTGTKKPAPAKAEKPVKKADKKPGFFKRTGAKIKDIFSELKKVSWSNVIITMFTYRMMQIRQRK